MKAGIICQACGVEAPTRYVEFYQNIGALIMRFSKHIKGNLCKSCVHKNYWSMTTPTLLIGWLGLISLFLAPIFVLNNTIRYLLVLGMPPVPPGATPPVVNQDVLKQFGPHADAVFQRLNAGEGLTEVAQAVAPKIGLTPGQVVQSVIVIAEAEETRHRQAAAVSPPKT